MDRVEASTYRIEGLLEKLLLQGKKAEAENEAEEEAEAEEGDGDE